MPLFPHEARLRNLTYSTEVYVMAQMKLLKREPKLSDPLAIGMADLKLNAEEEAGQFSNGYKVIKADPAVKVYLGKVPVMVRSQYCQLQNIQDHDT